MNLATQLAVAVGLFLTAIALGNTLDYWNRKLYARMQSRLGPLFVMYRELRGLLGSSRLLQPIYDVAKLWGKQTIVPKTARKTLFKLAPVLALCAASATVLLTPACGVSVLGGFEFSLIAIIYLLTVVSFSWILGAAASSSYWGAIGGRREAELFLGCEVPLIISLFSAAILARSESIHELIQFQRGFLPIILLNPFAAFAAFFAMLGKLHLKPFDIPAAEVEIVAGPFTEYSGKLLAVIYFTRMFLFYLLPAVFVDAFLSGGLFFTGVLYPLNIPVFLGFCFLLMFLLSAIHTAMPRYRIDQGFKFYLKYIWPVAFAGLALSIALVYMGVV